VTSPVPIPTYALCDDAAWLKIAQNCHFFIPGWQHYKLIQMNFGMQAQTIGLLSDAKIGPDW